MTSNALNEEVRAFFQSYTAAFEALDVEAIADCVAYPSHIVSDGEEVVLIAMADRQGCLAAMDKWHCIASSARLPAAFMTCRSWSSHPGSCRPL